MCVRERALTDCAVLLQSCEAFVSLLQALAFYLDLKSHCLLSIVHCPLLHFRFFIAPPSQFYSPFKPLQNEKVRRLDTNERKVSCYEQGFLGQLAQTHWLTTRGRGLLRPAWVRGPHLLHQEESHVATIVIWTVKISSKLSLAGKGRCPPMPSLRCGLPSQCVTSSMHILPPRQVPCRP